MQAFSFVLRCKETSCTVSRSWKNLRTQAFQWMLLDMQDSFPAQEEEHGEGIFW